MGLFVDLIAAGESRTNDALELLCKAHGDDDGSIWDEHPSPFVRRLVELFTQRGLMRLQGFRDELKAWLEGGRYQPGGLLPRPAGSWQRWTAEELGLVGLYLRSLPPDDWTLDDHMMVVDYIAQRYMPADDMRTEAEWLASRAAMMGRVQANLESLTASQADALLPGLPETFASAPQRLRAVTEFATNRAAEHVTRVGDDTRHRMRTLVAQRLERSASGDLGGPSLETELGDAFGALNRDWRRIAVTEATEAQCQGYVAMQPAGRKVKRVERYRNACAWCAKLDGKVFEVVDPSAPEKDGATQIWAGKNNVGRSAAPRKRVGDLLVEREPHELWWPAAGAQHPHCRGRWVPVVDDSPGQDPEFTAWMLAKLKATEKPRREEK
jgi:hypothetical protein